MREMPAIQDEVGADRAALRVIGALRVLPVLTINAASNARPLARALKMAGLPCAEVTFRTAAAADAIREMAADPDMTVGAGTILTVEQVEAAAEAGAGFVVSPGFSSRVVAACLERGLPVIPGIATATDIQMALDAGITLVKLFPAEAIGGPKMLHALSAPFPMVRFIPTGGIDASNITDYLRHPAVVAVGGSWMATPQLIDEGKFDEITTRTADAVARARMATHVA